MSRLASPVTEMKSHYTVVVVGSGYGAAIAASRLARAGQSVCVLERGHEFQPGEYPNSEAEAAGQFQIDFPDRHVGNDTGLYDLRVNHDINVFAGCGLGGTSLVNANVALRAEPRIFEDERWPQALRDDVAGTLEEGYQRAEEMLKPTPYPSSSPRLLKLEALERAGSHLGSRFYRPPINVTFSDGVNHVGVEQQACTLCGDCVSGCNYAAKNTLLMNYLPDARNHGAEIFTGAGVQRVSRENGRWLVHYQILDSGREAFDASTLFVSADVVVLGAGSLGSTEILLRSRATGLPLSDQLGHRFSGNADVIGFGYNNDVPINGVGFGDDPPGEHAPVGPTITGIIDSRDDPALNDGLVIEEGVIPGGVARFLPEAFAAGGALIGRDTDRGFSDFLKELWRKLVSLVRRSRSGAMHNTQTFLVMGHDDAEGHMYLQDDRLRIDWPRVGQQAIFGRINALLQKATQALGGTYIKNPISTQFTGHDVITVHPMGGCAMGESAESGVVNHKGQAFSGSQGSAVHETLYVSDASIFPRSLGVNPLLTISALAERSCKLLAEDRGWHFNYDLPSRPTAPSVEKRLGIQFTEKMAGYFSTTVTNDFESGASQGEQENSPCHFILSIISHDLEGMLEDESHPAGMTGTVVAPSLSSKPLTVRDGMFNLFTTDPDEPDASQMRYRMTLTAEDGSTYRFDGFKRIHDDPGFDRWTDTTTLFITVYSGDGEDAQVLGKGILKIEPDDFARQMTTMKAINAEDVGQAAEATARFGKFFAGELWNTYGLG